MQNAGHYIKTACYLTLICAGVLLVASAQEKNDFDLSGALIPPDKILQGGPPRDGIPAIDQPKFVPAGEVDYLLDDDIVIALQRDGVARAYPNRILIWHEIVNDIIGDEAVAVTYCPLCGTGMVFDRVIGGETLSFGVSGLLYQSDVLMFDRSGESLWSQLAMRAVTGPAAGVELRWLPAEHLTWKAWRQQHPDGEVLSTDTGYRRHYAGEAYAGYFASDEAMFPVDHTRRELANKALIAGVVINGEAKAYPLDALPPQTPVTDTVGGRELIVRYLPEAKNPRIHFADGTPAPVVVAFWFAWQAFYPQTGLWADESPDKEKT